MGISTFVWINMGEVFQKFVSALARPFQKPVFNTCSSFGWISRAKEWVISGYLAMIIWGYGQFFNLSRMLSWVRGLSVWERSSIIWEFSSTREGSASKTDLDWHRIVGTLGMLVKTVSVEKILAHASRNIGSRVGSGVVCSTSLEEVSGRSYLRRRNQSALIELVWTLLQVTLFDP